MPIEMLTGTMLMPDGSTVSYDGVPTINFKVVFDRLPNTIFFLQGFKVPGITIQPISRATPLLDLNEVGEKLDFGAFEIDFLIDSSMKNYNEIYRWMKSITVRGSAIDSVSDCVVIINDARKVRFVDCWPISIGGMEFKANASDMQYLTCTAVFNYDWHEFTE